VRHPQYGLGTVRAIQPHAAEIEFDDASRTLDPDQAGLEPAEPQAALSGLTVPLAELVRETVEATVTALGLEKPEAVTSELARRWHGGRLVLHPADPALQTRELPLETFFHKIVILLSLKTPHFPWRFAR